LLHFDCLLRGLYCRGYPSQLNAELVFEDLLGELLPLLGRGGVGSALEDVSGAELQDDCLGGVDCLCERLLWALLINVLALLLYQLKDLVCQFGNDSRFHDHLTSAHWASKVAFLRVELLPEVSH